MAQLSPDQDKTERDGRRRLSKMLFACRENLEMWADVVEARGHGQPLEIRRLVREIDEFRKTQGWNPDGYGGEK